MGERPFITQPLSVCLDLLRFLSAFLVMVGHAVQIGLYTGPWPFTPRLQLNCVLVFFVLSGLVIAGSVQREGSTASQYALARMSRILPVALAAIAFGSVAFLLGHWAGVPEFHGHKNAEFSILATVMPMLFLSESPIGVGPIWNPPYWSLCYEVWYYVIFGSVTFMQGWRRILALLGSCVLAGPNILLLLPVWWVGVWLAQRGANFQVSRSRALLLLTGCVTAFVLVSQIDLQLLFWLRPRVPWSLGQSEWVLSDLLLAPAIGAGIVGLRSLLAGFPPALKRIQAPARWAAGFSFTIYLFHWPLLALAHSAGLARTASPLAFAGWLVALLIVCAIIAELIERRTPALRREVARRLTPEPGLGFGDYAPVSIENTLPASPPVTILPIAPVLRRNRSR